MSIGEMGKQSRLDSKSCTHLVHTYYNKMNRFVIIGFYSIVGIDWYITLNLNLAFFANRNYSKVINKNFLRPNCMYIEWEEFDILV